MTRLFALFRIAHDDTIDIATCAPAMVSRFTRQQHGVTTPLESRGTMAALQCRQERATPPFRPTPTRLTSAATRAHKRQYAAAQAKALRAESAIISLHTSRQKSAGPSRYFSFRLMYRASLKADERHFQLHFHEAAPVLAIVELGRCRPGYKQQP